MMKYFPIILLITVLVALAGGCKDAPVDPVTGTPIIGDNDTSGSGPTVRPEDTCTDCIRAMKRPPTPYFCIFFRTGPNDSDRIELKIRPLIRQYHIDTYANGYPKSMLISLTLDVPGDTLSVFKNMHNIDLTIAELVPYPPARPEIRFHGEPAYGRSGMAFLYETESDHSLVRLSTADSIQGSGQGKGHSEIWFKIDRLDAVHRTLSGWLYDGKFIQRDKNLELSPIFFSIPY